MLKVNSIVDPGIISALYVASQAGVPIDLIVRGMCSAVPGVPHVSETITVRSIVGRYLEHSRILCFGQGERERFLIGSADMMERNLDRRVEALVPVDEPALQDRLRGIIEVMLQDDRRAWQLDREGDWRRVETLRRAPAGSGHLRDTDGARDDPLSDVQVAAPEPRTIASSNDHASRVASA